jgi:hypothetical protein
MYQQLHVLVHIIVYGMFSRATPHVRPTWLKLYVIFLLHLSSAHTLSFPRNARTSAFVPRNTKISHPPSARRQKYPSFMERSPLTTLNESILDRFTDPKIEDPRLPLAEAGIAQIVAPTMELFWLQLNQSPFPSWAIPLYDYTFTPRGALLAPTLIHGAGLACAWLLGCLAARAYERNAYQGNITQVVSTTLKAGAFACGILILATQVDLYKEMGGYVQVGDSAETDLRIYRALVEVIDDIFFEALTLLTWRILRSRVA